MEDSLGRKIDVSNMNLAQIKSMISSMMTGNVKKSDFKTIPDQNVQALSRLSDLLKKLNSSFDRQVAQINDYVAGMKNVIREINESRKETENATKEAGRTFKELDSNSKILNNLISKGNESLKRVTSAGSSRLNISISAMTPYLKAMTGSLQGMSSIFNRLIELWKPFVASGLEKGSIYVHDIYAQALLREIAKHQGVSGSDFSDIPDKLKELQALAGSKDSKELEKVMKKQNDRILKNLTGGTNKKGIMFGSKTIREMSIISGTSDFKEALEAAQLDETQITAVVDAINSGNMSGKQLKTQLMSQGFKTKDIEAVNDAFKSLNAGSNALSRQGLREATNMLESFTDNLFALEEKQSLYQSTLGGLADSAKYVVDYQKILYETSGITMASVEAQKELFNIDKQILQTGVDRKFAEVAILKNLKSGLRLNKESQKLVNAQLLTERQIGIESGSLTDEFRNLFESMKFSNIEVNELGRGLASVAKSAGISGDAMKEVLENTKKVTDTLKQQGTFTAQANTQIAGIFAEAKKLDALEPIQEVFAGIEEVAKRTKGIEGVGRLVQVAAGKAQVSNDIYSRTLLNNSEKTREFVKAYKEQVLAYTGGIKNMDELRKLSYKASMGDEEARARLANMQLLFQRQYNTTAANQLKVVESWEESTAPPLEKLDKLNKKYAKGLILKPELEERTNELLLSSSMKLLGALGDAAEMAEGTISDVHKSYTKSVQDGLTGERDMTLGANYPVSAEATIRTSLEQVQKGLKKNGLQELKISQKEIDEAIGNREKLTELVKTIQEAEARTRSEEQKKSNPLTAASAAMTELNNTLRDMTNSLFFQLQSTLGPNGFLYLGLGSVFATAFLKSKTFLSGPLGNAIGKQLGKIPGLRNLARANPMAALTNSMTALTNPTITSSTAKTTTVLGTAIESLGARISSLYQTFNNFGRMLYRGNFSGIFTRIGVSLGLLKDTATGTYRGIGGAIRGIKARTTTFITHNPFFEAKTFTGLRTSTTAFMSEFAQGMRNFIRSPLKEGFKITNQLATKGFGGLISVVGKQFNKVPGIGTIVAASIGGIIGAFDGYNNAARNFGVKTKELTTGMRVASTTGGALAGAIDGVFFGLFSLTGTFDILEKFLTTLTYGIMEFGRGLYEGFIEGYKYVKPWVDQALQILSEGFGYLKDTFGEIIDVILEAFGLNGPAGEGMKTFFDFMFETGKVVGKLVGNVLGFGFAILVDALGALAFVIGVVLKILKPFIKVFFEGLGHIFKGIGKIFSGIKKLFTPGYFLEGMGQILKGIGQIAFGILEAFLTIPIGIMDGILSIFGMGGSFKDKIVAYFKWMYESFELLFTGNFKGFGEKIKNLFVDMFTGIKNALPYWAKKLLGIKTEEEVKYDKSRALGYQLEEARQKMVSEGKTGPEIDKKLAEIQQEFIDKQGDIGPMRGLVDPKTVAAVEARKEKIAASSLSQEQKTQKIYEEDLALRKLAVQQNTALMDRIEYQAQREASKYIDQQFPRSRGESLFGDKQSRIDMKSAMTSEYTKQYIKQEAEKQLAEAGVTRPQQATAAPATTTPTQQATAKTPAAAAAAAATPTQQATAKAPAAPVTPATSVTTPTQKVEQAQMPKLTKRVGDPNLRLPGYGKVQLWDSDQGRIMIDSNNVMYKQGSGGKWDKIGNAPSVPQMEIGSELIKRAGIAFLHAGEMVLPSAAAGMMAESAGAFSNDLLKPIAAASNIAQVAPSDNGLVKTTAAQKEFDRSMELSILQHRANMELFKQITDNTEKSQENLYELLDKMDKLIEQAKKSNEDFVDGDGDEYMGNSIVKLQPSSAYGRINGSAIRNMT